MINQYIRYLRPVSDESERRHALMDLQALLTFKVVAAELSFTKAAGILGYVQSSVTTQMQGLERDLQTRLFERLGRKVALTDAGQRLLLYVDRLLALNDEARSAVSGAGDASGTLVIGAPDSLCAYRLPVVLEAFRREYPRMKIIFRPTRSCKEARRAVAQGLVDAALLLDDSVDRGSLCTEQLKREPLSLLVPSDHPLVQLESVNAEDLQDLPAVLTEEGCGYRDLFERIVGDSDSSRRTTVEFASIDAIKASVKVGMGFTLLPTVAVASELANKELVALPWHDQPLDIATQLVWHKDKWLSPTLVAFLDCTRRELGDNAPVVDVMRTAISGSAESLESKAAEED
jgi:DNA-binding transcriptional LysR family regulator